MTQIKILIVLISFLLNISLTISQWTLCPGSGSITGIGINPVISVADFNLIAVAGGTPNSPKVYLTTNGGNNFNNITGNLTGPDLFAVYLKSSSLIFAGDGGANGGAGGNAKVWKTTNMGVNWTVVLTTGGTAGFINGIRFSQTNSNYGIIVSDGPTGSGILVYKTTDGGNNWSQQSVSAGYNTAAMGSLFILSDLIYGFGGNGVNNVTYTTNGGINWSFVNIPLTGTGVLVDCYNQNCIAVTLSSLPNIYKFQLNGTGSTINTGMAVSSASSIIFPGGLGIAYISALVGNNPLIKTQSYGLNWSQVLTSSVNSISCVDSRLIINAAVIWNAAVSTSGQVVKSYDALEGVIKTNETTPSEFKMEQNYPNPFNPSTTIKFSIPLRGFVNLKVYNSIGENINELVNTDLAAGNYTVDFNSQNLSSGIYYYTIISGDFKETKKMVLVK